MSGPALRATLLLWLGALFALFGVERLLLDPLGSISANLAVFIFQTVLILVCATQTLRHSARAGFWAVLASLLYFAHGVSRAAAPDDRTVAAFEIAFALGLFVTALLLLRRSRAATDP